MKKDIKTLRTEIDKIDKDIIALIANRMKVSIEIGKQKQQKGLVVVDEKREADILNDCIALGSMLGVSESLINKIFSAIIKESRQIQDAKK